ncbi:MAG: metallophosphoesterase [Sphingomicrobium sp.]
MFRRLWSFVAALVCLAAALAMPAAAIPPHVPPPTPRIIAVGDLHGDFAVWQAIARAAGLIDAGGHWSGGQSILVQLGDITDRGPDSLKIIRHLKQLQKEAPRARGRVVVLIGNHEAMQMIGDLRYVSPGEYAAFADRRSARRRSNAFIANKTTILVAYRARELKLSDAEVRARWIADTPIGKVEHQAAWAPSGELGLWTLANPAVALVDGNLFVHGGLSRAFAATQIADINRQIHAALEVRDERDESIISDQTGPLWYRGLAERATASGQPDPTEAELTDVLAATGARRMIIAHTPNLSGIVISHAGRLARVDTGNSIYYNGTPSYLEILGNRLFPHAVPRPAGDRR